MQLHVSLVGLLSIMGDLSRFTAAYSFIPLILQKKLLAKVIPSLPACFAKRWYHRVQQNWPGRQAGSKEAFTPEAASQPHGRAVLENSGHPATLPAHPVGSTLVPWHRNPLPHSAKAGCSNIMSQALLLALEKHDTGFQIEDLLK